jgi:capsular polysaccharide biosynthesis protein
MPGELETAIAKALQDEQIIVDPFVTVTVAEYNSHPISVAGAVKQPLTFQATGPGHVARSHHPRRRPEPRSRPGNPGHPHPARSRWRTSALVQRILVKGLIDAADPALNIVLNGGEEIRVPESGKVYVIGNVKMPGAFPVGDGTESSVLKMLASPKALCPMPPKKPISTAAKATAARTKSPSLCKIMERKAPDTPLLANDILYVPDNKGRRMTLGALEKIAIGGTARRSRPLFTRSFVKLEPYSLATNMSEPNRSLPLTKPVQPTGTVTMSSRRSVRRSPGHYLWILRRHRWKILGFVFGCVAATIIVSARLTPVYESTVTVDVDRQMPSAVIGQDATRMPANDADQFLATQIKLIQSDSVLRPVAEQYHLLDVEKRVSEAPTVSGPTEDAPILLKKLKVTRPPNTYLLLISYRSTDPRLAADVANGVARSYVEHTYNIRSIPPPPSPPSWKSSSRN